MTSLPLRALPLLLLLAASPASAAPEVAIEISNFTFSPAEISVPAGATVTWVNDDDIPHRIAATDGGFRSGALDTGDRWSFTFAEPGQYAYFCSSIRT